MLGPKKKTKNKEVTVAPTVRNVMYRNTLRPPKEELKSTSHVSILYSPSAL